MSLQSNAVSHWLGAKISREYHGGWCPGSLCHQDSSCHSIGCAGWTVQLQYNFIFWNTFSLTNVNSLWPCNAIWQHRSGSKLAQVMAWCRLPEPILSWNYDFWYPSQCNFTEKWTKYTDKNYRLIKFLKIFLHLPGDDELTHWGLVTPFGDIDLGQHWLR